MEGKWVASFPFVVIALMVISLFLPIMTISLFHPIAINPEITGEIMPLGGGLVDLIPVVPDTADLITGFTWVGIIFAIFYGLDAFLLFINAIRVMTGSKELKKARKKWLSGGIAKIIAQIVLIVVMTTVVTDAIADLGVTLGFIMGLGMILTIVSGGILIFAWIIAKIIS